MAKKPEFAEIHGKNLQQEAKSGAAKFSQGRGEYVNLHLTDTTASWPIEKKTDNTEVWICENLGGGHFDWFSVLHNIIQLEYFCRTTYKEAYQIDDPTPSKTVVDTGELITLRSAVMNDDIINLGIDADALPPEDDDLQEEDGVDGDEEEEDEFDDRENTSEEEDGKPEEEDDESE
ncbi:uncharacterized protein LOC130973813 [Arachis stenosperma]|uniref:uncharacterized protein LOC130973813 n=1 Tax=Arachis stenosperma TaxID=217475 RepID=UPI0025AC294F|nr:uncharacterized protein LOC130973813 [Arachis stenosperma]